MKLMDRFLRYLHYIVAMTVAFLSLFAAIGFLLNRFLITKITTNQLLITVLPVSFTVITFSKNISNLRKKFFQYTLFGLIIALLLLRAPYWASLLMNGICIVSILAIFLVFKFSK